MASNPFAKRASRAAASGSPRPQPLVNPGGVKPPFYPRRKLPRVTPLTPRVPVKLPPLFPGGVRPKSFKVPFGKKYPFTIPSPFGPGKVDWFGPVVGAAVVMVPYILPYRKIAMPAGWRMCYDLGGPKDAQSGPVNTDCGTLKGQSGQVPSGVAGDPISVTTSTRLARSMYFGPYDNPAHTRMTYREQWWIPRDNTRLTPWTADPQFYVPDIWPIQPPSWWPWIPDPLAPEPPPLAPPIYPGSPPVPKGWPDPAPNPVPEPPVAVSPVPVLPPAFVPAITVDSGSTPFVTLQPHIKEPPDGPTKEKKKRIKGFAAYPWLNAIKGLAESYMELDDVVSAIYKGLPWQLRRWRGSDGVWRDRDIRTDTRLERIYGQLGRLDVQKAIQEVAKNEFSDKAFGKLGNTLKKRARELGDKGLWASSGGFQRGNNLVNDTWDDLYKQLKEEAAKDIRNHVQQYYTKEYDKRLGIWRVVWHNRPVIRIPWYKQSSHFPLQWYDKNGTLHRAPRYYYAASAS